MGASKTNRIVDPIITNLLLGYGSQDYVGDALFPVVDHTKEGGKIPKFGKTHFRQHATERALRAKSNVIVPDLKSSVRIAMDEHDASLPLDIREVADSDLDEQSAAAFAAQEIIFHSRELACATLARDATKYAAANKVTLSGTDQFDNSGSDPIVVIRAGQKAIRAAVAKYPTTIVIGAAVWEALQDHAKITARISHSQHAVLTPELFGQMFGFKDVRIGSAVTVDDQDAVTDVWGKDIVMAFVPTAMDGQKRSLYMPAYGYTVRRKGYPQGDIWYSADGKVSYVRSTELFDVAQTGADAGYLIKAAVS